MPTNLQIGYADIPFAATSFTAFPTEASGYPLANLLGGNRTELFRTPSHIVNTMTVTVPLAAAKAANFLFVGNANLLKAEGVTTLALFRNTVNTIGTGTVVVSVALASETLYGPQATDVIRTFTATAAYQYWWFRANTSGPMTSPFSSLMFGTAFDMGCDPEADNVEITRFHPHPSQRRAMYRVRLTWNAVAKAKAISFYNTFMLQKRHRPAVLYTSSYHAILNDHRVLFGRFVEVAVPPKVTEYNTVSATFEEVA